jgi:hypothetical protein
MPPPVTEAPLRVMGEVAVLVDTDVRIPVTVVVTR